MNFNINMNKINIAVIGLGRAGQYHIQHLPFPGKLFAVYDINQELTVDIAKKYQCLPIFDINDIIEDDRIQGVIIASPTTTHYRYIIDNIKHDKKIFTEKPLSNDLDEIYNVFSLNPKLLFVGFNRRYDPNFLELISKLPSIGKLQLLKITSRDYPSANIDFLKTSGGIYHDMIIHDIDMARFITQKEPISVYSLAHAFNPEIANIGDFDNVQTFLDFGQGLVCIIDNSRETKYGYDQRIEILGENGMLTVGNERKDTIKCYTDRGEDKTGTFYSFIERYRRSYINEMFEFINCCIDIQKPKITYEDCRNNLIICNAALKSAIIKEKILLEL